VGKRDGKKREVINKFTPRGGRIIFLTRETKKPQADVENCSGFCAKPKKVGKMHRVTKRKTPVKKTARKLKFQKKIGKLKRGGLSQETAG